jgi:hypothetical protein
MTGRKLLKPYSVNSGPPRSNDPLPNGFMYWHGEIVSVAWVEKHCRRTIGRHDQLPRSARDRANADAWPSNKPRSRK